MREVRVKGFSENFDKKDVRKHLCILQNDSRGNRTCRRRFFRCDEYMDSSLRSGIEEAIDALENPHVVDSDSEDNADCFL